MHSIKHRPFTLSIAALLLLPVVGCHEQGDRDDAVGNEGAALDAIDPDDPCGTLLAEGEPPLRAAWVRVPDPYFKITQDIGVTWFAEYAARVPLDQRADAVLELERCDTPAHRDTTCATSLLPLPTDACGTNLLRFGVDPSQYRRGTNLYTFTLRLRRRCAVDSADAFSLTVEYGQGR